MGRGRPLTLHRYPGGKSRLRWWIIPHLPAHSSYVEGFAGAASVLLGKGRSPEEALIERHPWQATLLRIVRDDHRGLVELLRPLRWCEDTFKEARWRLLADDHGTDIELAALTYTWRKMSRCGEGDVFSRCDDRDTQAWWDNGVAQLPAIAERLRGVTVIRGDSLDVLPTLDRPDALFYLDPPYVHSGRGNHRIYKRCEMSDRDHRRLCRIAKGLEGRVALSGYDNAIYDEELGGWRKESKEVFLFARFDRNAASRPKKTECLWLNF